MSGIGINLRVTGHCSQGGRKYMEDMFSVAYQQTVDLKDLEYAFFGIFDGHGGPQAARFAKEHLLDSIVNQRNFWSNNDQDVLRAIRDGYIATHYAMWKDLQKWPKTTTGLPSTSGSTATVAFIMKGKIYIGHVGDTAIVLGYQEAGVKEWKAKVLTKDHKPENKEEKQRIELSGGKVVNKSGVPRVVWNRPRLGHQGPVRRSTPIDEIPFLAVARSLGDFWSYNSALNQFVVSPEPDVLVYPVDVLRFRCLVLGTDGLWNMMTPDRAVTIVQATEIHNEKQVIFGLNNQYNKDWVNPSKTLVDRALERWVNTKLRADNTSVVTLLLDPPGPPKAQVLLKQINKWKGGNHVSEEEENISVPKSGGLAIFTHYPSSEDSEFKHSCAVNSNDVKEERIMKFVKKLQGNDAAYDDVTKLQREEKEPRVKETFVPKKVGEKEPGKSDWSGCLDTLASMSYTFKHSSIRNRSEENSSAEETSSDTENERIFPECESKKRRLSLDKKCTTPGTRRRPSLPALNGKTGSLCKSRSLEESTRMLRSATPIKTLRSRNIDLSDLSPSVVAKRNREPSPLIGKKQRLDEQHSTPNPLNSKRKLPNKTDIEQTKSTFLKSYLVSEDSNWQDNAVSSREISEDCKSQPVSDSELSPIITSFVPQKRRLRFQEGCSTSNLLSKRKLKTSNCTLNKRSSSTRSSVDSLLDNIN